MKREFKPGDVAKACYDGDELIYLRVRSRYNEKGERWESQEGSHSYAFESADWFRPLVVIDPEDREQVERLARLWASHAGEFDTTPGRMAAALREFANPTPPIEEPTGLGAVVEDAEGRKFVRVADPVDGWMVGKQWQRIGGEISAVRNFGWSDLRNVVRVLSEGVS